MCVSGSDFCLYVPMTRKEKLITIGQSGSGKFTLIAAVFYGFGKVDTFEETARYGKRYVGYVHLSTHGMHAEEMPVET